MLAERTHPIFVLEDDPDDLSFIQRALTRANIDNPLEVRATVADARNYFTSLDGTYHPALCLLDIYLPDGETGLDFLAWLRRQPPPIRELPVMIFSVSTDEAHRMSATALRSVIFLTKPVTEAALTDAVLALGFVITTNVSGGRARRIIEPR
jgi:CheY-like chemotaxis protein